MAPATRSSAPSTPAKSGPRTSTSDGPVTPPSANTRRTPRCTKCHRPRAGHPRSGCPYVGDSSQNVSSASPPTSGPTTSSADDGILEELSSLHIVSPSDWIGRASGSAPHAGSKSNRRLSVRFALVPEQTLASLSATDSHLVEQLLQPGMISDVVSPQDKVAHVLKWRSTLDDANVFDGGQAQLVGVKTEPSPSNSDNSGSSLSRTMPCTLSTPTASLTTTEPVTDQGIGGSVLNMNETVYLLPDHGIAKTKPLSRSMSCEQRSLFLQQLAHSSSTAPATLISLPLEDLGSVRADAEKIGFIVRVLPSRANNHRWVVLGTETEAVEVLAGKFLQEEKRGTSVARKGGTLSAVTGGVIFGAVATWTGLAFS